MYNVQGMNVSMCRTKLVEGMKIFEGKEEDERETPRVGEGETVIGVG